MPQTVTRESRPLRFWIGQIIQMEVYEIANSLRILTPNELSSLKDGERESLRVSRLGVIWKITDEMAKLEEKAGLGFTETPWPWRKKRYAEIDDADMRKALLQVFEKYRVASLAQSEAELIEASFNLTRCEQILKEMPWLKAFIFGGATAAIWMAFMEGAVSQFVGNLFGLMVAIGVCADHAGWAAGELKLAQERKSDSERHAKEMRDMFFVAEKQMTYP